MHFRLALHGLDESQPLIYMWEIRGTDGSLIGRYVGKSKAGAHRPLRHYARNVANILEGKPYRKSNPTGYRRIHYVLAEAERQGYVITLHFLCNVASNENINEIEQRHIFERNSQGSEAWQLNG